MIPREVVEAAEEIKKFEKNDNPDACKTINLGETAGKHVHIDHMNLLNSLVKFVSFVRMPNVSKGIMLAKLTHPGLTNMEIAMQRGMRITDIDLYEAEGKKRVCDALNSTTLQDAISKYNTEDSVDNAVKNIKAEDIGGNKLD